MRFFVFPLAALAVISGGFDDEPTEIEMQRAFESSLRQQVRNMLGYIADTQGDAAVQKIRQAGSDRFRIRTFRKLGCNRTQGEAHHCSFAVEIELMNGTLRRRIDGQFAPGTSGQLGFAESA
jgi:hypothetical protein